MSLTWVEIALHLRKPAEGEWVATVSVKGNWHFSDYII